MNLHYHAIVKYSLFLITMSTIVTAQEAKKLVWRKKERQRHTNAVHAPKPATPEATKKIATPARHFRPSFDIFPPTYERRDPQVTKQMLIDYIRAAQEHIPTTLNHIQTIQKDLGKLTWDTSEGKNTIESLMQLLKAYNIQFQDIIQSIKPSTLATESLATLEEEAFTLFKPGKQDTLAVSLGVSIMPLHLSEDGTQACINDLEDSEKTMKNKLEEAIRNSVTRIKQSSLLPSGNELIQEIVAMGDYYSSLQWSEKNFKAYQKLMHDIKTMWEDFSINVKDNEATKIHDLWYMPCNDSLKRIHSLLITIDKKKRFYTPRLQKQLTITLQHLNNHYASKYAAYIHSAWHPFEMRKNIPGVFLQDFNDDRNHTSQVMALFKDLDNITPSLKQLITDYQTTGDAHQKQLEKRSENVAIPVKKFQKVLEGHPYFLENEPTTPLEDRKYFLINAQDYSIRDERGIFYSLFFDQPEAADNAIQFPLFIADKENNRYYLQSNQKELSHLIFKNEVSSKKAPIILMTGTINDPASMTFSSKLEDIRNILTTWVTFKIMEHDHENLYNQKNIIGSKKSRRAK